MQYPSALILAPLAASAAAHAPDLCELHPRLLRYARSRVHNLGLAEDAVSETLLAAWERGAVFPTPAKATAWVFGILRHKLVDQLRQQGRETPAGEQLPEPDTRSLDWYVGGDWCGVTSAVSEPDQACSRRQFVELLLRCCERLPPAQRQAFVMREIDGDDPASVCQQLGVTEGNLWVLVHRARVQLRAMLGEHWLLPHELRAMSGPAAPLRKPVASAS
jgi:RNA polymerase sigma-70 factor (ECF subfamily)